MWWRGLHQRVPDLLRHRRRRLPDRPRRPVPGPARRARARTVRGTAGAPGRVRPPRRGPRRRGGPRARGGDRRRRAGDWSSCATYGRPDRDPREPDRQRRLARHRRRPARARGGSDAAARLVRRRDVLRQATAGSRSTTPDPRRRGGTRPGQLEYSPLAAAFCRREFTVGELRGSTRRSGGSASTPPTSTARSPRPRASSSRRRRRARAVAVVQHGCTAAGRPPRSTRR